MPLLLQPSILLAGMDSPRRNSVGLKPDLRISQLVRKCTFETSALIDARQNQDLIVPDQ
jgi:hypothetical protein